MEGPKRHRTYSVDDEQSIDNADISGTSKRLKEDFINENATNGRIKNEVFKVFNCRHI